MHFAEDYFFPLYKDQQLTEFTIQCSYLIAVFVMLCGLTDNLSGQKAGLMHESAGYHTALLWCIIVNRS